MKKDRIYQILFIHGDLHSDIISLKLKLNKEKEKIAYITTKYPRLFNTRSVASIYALAILECGSSWLSKLKEMCNTGYIVVALKKSDLNYKNFCIVTDDVSIKKYI